MSEKEEAAAFSDDLLRGADAISEYLFGDRKMRRKVYHLSSTSNIPLFKLGSLICARKSVLLDWIAKQEARHANDNFPSNVTPFGKV